MDNSTASLINTSSSISEQKYLTLRKRLDQLGYRQTLGIESLPLVDKLFNDLIHTTESLKKAKLERVSSSSSSTGGKSLGDGDTSKLNTSCDLNLSTTNLNAYKSDNAKLIKENNDLHLELIKIKDENEQALKELKVTLRKIEHENSDLRFLNTQYIHKLRAIEKESKDKSKKILELQEKNFQAVIQTPNGAKQTCPFRRQRLDIDCLVPNDANLLLNKQQQQQQSKQTASIQNDAYIIDMIKLADDRIEQLQNQLDNAKQSHEIMDTKLSNYKNQVENRDKEIERLNRLLDGGRPHDVVSLEAKLRNNDKLIAHQNLQIEYLHDKNHQLEARLQELMTTTKRETFKNDDLFKLAKQAEFEKKLTVEAVDRELLEARYEIQKSREELNNLDNTVNHLHKEKHELLSDIDELKSQLQANNAEIENLNNLIEKLQDDKTKLSKKVAKLLENEKELVSELDSQKTSKRASSAKSGTKTTTKSTSLMSKVDSYIKNIEGERDFYKQEVDTLNKLLKAQKTSLSPLNGYSPSGGAVSTSPLRKSRKSTSQSPSKKNTQTKTSKSPSPSPSRKSLKSQSIVNLTSSNDLELNKVIRERDELKVILDKFERHMSEIQANVKVLTNERDKINHLYEETRDELQRTRRELLKSPKAPNVSLAAQTILKRVENERDTALFELRAATNERDSLKERLKIATETSIQEKAKLEQQCEDLGHLLKTIDLEKNELYQQIDLFKAQMDDLENKFRSQNYSLTQTMQELNEQRNSATQIRLLAEESERAIEEQRRQLAIKNEELSMSQQINYKLEQKLHDLQELNRSLKDEVNALRYTINALDKDKDKLLCGVDEKTEENVTLKHELASKHKRIDELNNQLVELDAALDRANDEMKNKNKEVTTLRIQVDRENEEIGVLSRKLDVAVRENKRVQDDLITVTRENQILHCELDKSNMDKERLKSQVQDYINEVAKFEELLNQKEQDRSSLLDQYRETSNELSKMKMALNGFENEVSNLKIELQMKNTESKRLKERLDTLERDNQQQIAICQEYEVKLSNLNRSLQRHEDAIKKYQVENNELMSDLMHSRELNSRLEQAKEELTRQLTGRELDNEQLQNLLTDMKAESDLLKSQINSERTMVKNLEDLISNNREKDFHLQLQTQERDAELQLMKDKLNLADQKINTQSKEISQLRTKIVEYETENERVKRQLTNERFERERAAQELRKLSDSVEVNSTRLVRSISPSKSGYSSSLLSNTFKTPSRQGSPDRQRISPSRTQ